MSSTRHNIFWARLIISYTPHNIYINTKGVSFYLSFLWRVFFMWELKQYQFTQSVLKRQRDENDIIIFENDKDDFFLKYLKISTLEY